MKFAIIADIHGNLEALETVLEDARNQNPTHYVCLGDIVGYNANPKECLKIVRDMNIPCVKGNHDESRRRKWRSAAARRRISMRCTFASSPRPTSGWNRTTGLV